MVIGVLSIMRSIKRWLVWLVLALVLAFAGTAGAKERMIRDSWALVEQDNKPVGFGYDQCWRTDDGYRYITDLTLQLSMAGAPVKVIEHLEMEVDKAYLAKRFQMVMDAAGIRTIIGADFTPDAIQLVTTSSDGKENTRVISTDKPLYFSSSFVDAVMAKEKLAVGKEYQAAIWDLASYAVKDYRFKVVETKTYPYRGKKIKVFSITDSDNVNTLIDSRGDSYWAYEPKQKLTIRKVEKNEIPELQAVNVDVLIVPGNIRVARPFRSETSRIKVTWSEVPFTEFNLTDNRQQLVKHTQDATEQTVWVEIKRDTRDFTGKVKLPVKDEKFQPYLSETNFISPNLPEIRKLKDEVLAGESDGWLAAEKLVHWVFGYIQAEMIPQTLGTEQILKQKRGKCVEYAVLFAAMARAAGLPTRIALGERYQDGSWVGHMWNEVWLGEWVAVDPSHNQTAPDALLLKLVDSDTVLGTQKVRTGLIGKLGIIIEDVQVPEAESNPLNGLKTGIQDGIYTNVDFRCQLKLPADWTLTQTEEQGTPLMILQPAAAPGATAILVLSSIPAGTTGEQLLQSRIQMIQNAVQEFKLLARESGQAGRYPAVIGTWNFTYQDTRYQQQNWIVIQGDYLYLFVFEAPLDKWDTVQESFARIREGFKVF